MAMLLRHKVLIAVVSVVAAASAGVAFAATQSSSNPRQAYLNDVAKRLNVSPAKLDAALKAALVDRLNAMVKAGQLTQAQANAIEQRLQQGGRLPFFFGGGPGHLPLWPHGRMDGPLHAAASYLGLTDIQLLGDIRSGRSLADIAKSRGKSVSGLEQAITSSEKARLDRLVKAGVLTSADEQRLLSRLSAKISSLVNRRGFGHVQWQWRPGGPQVPLPPGGPVGGPPGTNGPGPDAGPPPPAI